MTQTLSQEDYETQARALKLDILFRQSSKLTEEARMTSAVSQVNEINVAREQRQEEAFLSGDLYHQRYYFTEDIDAKSVRECMQRCTYWANSKPRCDITIIFNCQGGELFFGMMLFDFITELRERGHIVRIGDYGLAASMAGILLQAASPGHRYVGKESWTLIHEVSSQARGPATSLANAADFAKAVCDRIRDIFLENQAAAKAAGTATETMTKAEFDQAWKNRDWWLDSTKMIALGFADKVGSPIFAATEAAEV